MGLGLLLIVLAIICAVLGFGGVVAGTLLWVFKVLCILFVIGAVVSFIRRNV